MLAAFGLAAHRKTAFSALSGGQQQRLFLILALLNRPRLVILDELTQGLDPASRRDVWDAILSLRHAGTTVLLVTHYMDEAEALCDRVAVLRAGRVIDAGRPRDLVERHAGWATMRFGCPAAEAWPDGLRGIDGVREVRRGPGQFEVLGDRHMVAYVCADLVRRGDVPDDLAVAMPDLEDALVALLSGEEKTGALRCSCVPSPGPCRSPTSPIRSAIRGSVWGPVPAIWPWWRSSSWYPRSVGGGPCNSERHAFAHDHTGHRAMNKGRVEAFSDGIFAIAITLLVLTIGQPTDYRMLAHQLADRWPSLAAYVVSFVIIGIMWLNHHTIFAHLERIDRGLFYRNLILVMTIVFIPYPTGVLGEALRLGEGATTAAAFYSATMAVNSYAWAALWLHASTDRRLLNRDFPESQRTTATILFTAGAVVYTAAIGIAFVSPFACLAFHGALAVYYAFDPISRRVGRGQPA